eukprot:TRINITY_DN108576_c0_g1_i1.p1 TRINITY_DN108576_c0_g1~~TRINITY_DN108576_c0_g1_i1.p1  ORF type:complete len:144 (-),score=41.05 TRINITY_DN108576_c0_g1_i1:632-1063(-)
MGFAVPPYGFLHPCNVQAMLSTYRLHQQHSEASTVHSAAGGGGPLFTADAEAEVMKKREIQDAVEKAAAAEEQRVANAAALEGERLVVEAVKERSVDEAAKQRALEVVKAEKEHLARVAKTKEVAEQADEPRDGTSPTLAEGP